MVEFDDFVKRLIVGANQVYFRDVIKASTGKDVLVIDKKLKNKLLLVKSHFQSNIKNISNFVEKNYKGRANELSNYLEPIVAEEIKKISGFEANLPTMLSGNKQSAGYPDLFVECNSMPFYLEVKTYQLKTANSALRTFYYQPSEKNKVTKSCPHLLIGFEVESLGESNRSPFIIKSFKLLDLYDLKVNLKPEFNANNIAIYSCTEI